MYEQILVLMEYIDGMVCWEFKTLRTNRVKLVLKVAAGIGQREGTGHLVDKKEINRKGSGEDYARKIIEFLEAAREARRKKKKEEDDVIKWNVSAEVFQPVREKGEAEKKE